MNSFHKVYKVVSKIPKGKVMTYKSVSIAAGVNNPRIVGYALHGNKDTEAVPCHRVIKSTGEIAEGYAFGGKGIQSKLLMSEGVEVTNNKVDLDKYLFSPNNLSI